jgi:hypothetical protein
MEFAFDRIDVGADLDTEFRQIFAEEAPGCKRIYSNRV